MNDREIDVEDYKDKVKRTRPLLFSNGKTDVSVEKIIEDLKEMAKSLI